MESTLNRLILRKSNLVFLHLVDLFLTPNVTAIVLNLHLIKLILTLKLNVVMQYAVNKPDMKRLYNIRQFMPINP